MGTFISCEKGLTTHPPPKSNHFGVENKENNVSKCDHPDNTIECLGQCVEREKLEADLCKREREICDHMKNSAVWVSFG